MEIFQYIKRPPWRTVFLLFIILGIILLAFFLWSPGEIVRDGRHDLRTNGIWIQHGWMGDDSWFQTNKRDKSLFRNDQKIRELANLFASHGIRYVFPHLCPCNPDGMISLVDSVQTERFLGYFKDFQVIPWIGGVLNVQCKLESRKWRINFISSVVELLHTHPRLAGVQINIEPMPSGNSNFLTLLEELRQEVPSGKIISVAAYPPPTILHPQPEVHWDEAYYRKVAKQVDQIVPMMYDTAIQQPKLYQSLMALWTMDILNWSEHKQVLLGVPVYDDAGVGYHLPAVENLQNALSGIHAGLSKYKVLPKNFAGVVIYCEWEIDQLEWNYFKKEFEKTPDLTFQPELDSVRNGSASFNLTIITILIVFLFPFYLFYRAWSSGKRFFIIFTMIYCLIYVPFTLQGEYKLSNQGGQDWALNWHPKYLTFTYMKVRPKDFHTHLGALFWPCVLFDRLFLHKTKTEWKDITDY